MISSISQSGSASSIWKAYQSRQTAASETSETTESNETSQIDDSMPPKGPPPPPPPDVSTTSTSTDSTSLTSEQEDLVSSILEDYDASSLTEEDATDIISALQQAGIPDSSALADTIESNGFDLQAIKDLVPVSATMPNGSLSQDYMDLRESMGSLSYLDDTSISQTAATETSETTESNETSQIDDSMPPPPKGPPPPPPPDVSATSTSTDSTSLTSEQEDLVSSILEDYDASSLTEADATDIISALQQAGIPDSSALADAIESNGFDLQSIKDLVPVSATMSNGSLSQNYMDLRESMGSLSYLDDTQLSQTTTTDQSFRSLFEQYQIGQNTASQMGTSILV